MNQSTTDEMYMRRCLQLAACGRRNASPNPMVGAVIVARGRIIGEGYHVRCGEGHAEVNAFASVAPDDERLLPEATMYVSLEPCAHYGKTPPCADLIVRKGVRRVVVGCVDTFAKVSGRGIEKLRASGIDVTVGVLESECRSLNRVFFTFNSLRRPFVTLKWAQSADGYIHDAILIGSVTDRRDNARLNVRHWAGKDPLRIVIDRERPFFPGLDFSRPVVPQLLEELWRRGVQSVLVEGGAFTHGTFIASGMWDEIRVETAPVATGGGTKAPQLPSDIVVTGAETYGANTIITYGHARHDNI